jgi:hypothetical protein
MTVNTVFWDVAPWSDVSESSELKSKPSKRADGKLKTVRCHISEDSILRIVFVV